MKRYPVSATMLARLAIRRDRQSDRAGAVTSVSGTMLRGALAQVYLQQRGAPDDGFKRLFLDDARCRFGPLDPAPAPLPLTAVSCKRQGGFRADGQHGMADLLWSRIAQRLAHDPETVPLARCPACNQDMKAQEGYYDAEALGQPARTTKPRRTVTAHVGIDRVSTTAADSILFTIESLEPQFDPDPADADLTGWIEADDEVHEDLRTLLEREEHRIALGHARTRGYGWTKLVLGESASERTGVGTWGTWSLGLLSFLGRAEFEIAGLDPKRHFAFALSLPTGAVLVDDLLRASLDPADAAFWLPALPEIDDDRPFWERGPTAFGEGRLFPLGAVTRHERVRGWNAAHGLPRQDDWALARGSVFAYLFEGPPDSLDILIGALEQLTTEGIGLRRGEGFGTVVVSDEFHRVYHQSEGAPK